MQTWFKNYDRSLYILQTLGVTDTIPAAVQSQGTWGCGLDLEALVYNPPLILLATYKNGQ